MVRYNDLHGRLELHGVSVQQFEELMHSFLILICQTIDAAVLITFRWIMRLGRLV